MLLMCPTIPPTTTPLHSTCYSVGTGTALMKLCNFKQLLKLKFSFVYTHLLIALIIQFAFTEGTSKLRVVEHLLMFHNIKIITKSDVISQLCHLELDSFTENSVICHIYYQKDSRQKASIFCKIHVSLYLKYLVSSCLKDFAYENYQYED